MSLLRALIGRHGASGGQTAPNQRGRQPSATASRPPSDRDQQRDRRRRSTQEMVVSLRDIRDDVLCLASEVRREKSSRRRRHGSVDLGSADCRYRAVLEVATLNFALKTAGEQEAIIAGYRAFLNGLSFPIQILVRVLPLDLAPYLARLHTSADAISDAITVGDDMRGAAPLGTCHQRLDDGHLRDGHERGSSNTAKASTAPYATSPDTHAVIGRLAADHERFVRHLAMQRTLLERRVYVILPADTAPPSDTPLAVHRGPSPRTHGVAALTLALRPGARRAAQVADAQAHFAAVAQRLDLRVSDVTRQLARFGVEARRLVGHELLTLYASCLSPAVAAVHPIPASALPTSLSAWCVAGPPPDERHLPHHTDGDPPLRRGSAEADAAALALASRSEDSEDPEGTAVLGTAPRAPGWNGARLRLPLASVTATTEEEALR